MAAIENIIAWAKHEQTRLTQQLHELQSGRLRTFEKHDQLPGWLEIDTTEHTIELNRLYISELNAIIALHPTVEPTIPAAPPPVPRFIPPTRETATMADAIAQMPRDNLVDRPIRLGVGDDNMIAGWGVVKGQPPRWVIVGLYYSHAHANEVAAEAGDGYYARRGLYNSGTRHFSSGSGFTRA
jgi:hypothetical protein